VDLVGSLLVKSGLCRIRFWYAVAPGSGISRKAGRIFSGISHQFFVVSFCMTESSLPVSLRLAFLDGMCEQYCTVWKVRAVRCFNSELTILVRGGITLGSGLDKPMNYSEDKRELPDVGVDVPPWRSTMLCSLRVVPVSSELS
jgi:hypothetical protein